MDEIVRVSKIIVRLSDDRTQACLRCTSPERENDLVLVVKMEVLEQLKMAAIRATRGHSREPDLEASDD
jgi:hypothetical protein